MRIKAAPVNTGKACNFPHYLFDASIKTLPCRRLSIRASRACCGVAIL
jgi:hypothetical protein